MINLADKSAIPTIKVGDIVAVSNNYPIFNGVFKGALALMVDNQLRDGIQFCYIKFITPVLVPTVFGGASTFHSYTIKAEYLKIVYTSSNEKGEPK